VVQYEIKIHGRVQGVGFRYFTQQKAKELEINGWVKNMRDGGVWIMAQGDKNTIDTFIDYLKIGPTHSRVDKISKTEVQFVQELSKFKITF